MKLFRSTLISVLLLSIGTQNINAQFLGLWGKPKKQQTVYRVAPPHWYTNLYQDLELIIHAENANNFTFGMNYYEGVNFLGTEQSQNRHIVYIKLKITPEAKPGEITFQAIPKKGIKPKPRYFEFTYELKERQNNQGLPITSQDVTYLIFPDRFSNGDITNDEAEVQFPEKIDRVALKARHGGDIAGISNKLDYLKDLGISTLWLNPVQINDQEKESFHGYAITDHYRIDPRLGTNEEYKNLSDELKRRNMKLVMDIIPNHTGDNHWMHKFYDTGWFHFKDSFVRSNFRANTTADPYASKDDKMLMTDGSFVKTMPDFNQSNPHIRKYLDQMYLWWIEYAGLSGYRIDTYPFADQDYMNHLNSLILKYYPDFTIYGETWVEETLTQAVYCKNNIKGFEKNTLPGLTDFVMCWAMHKAGTEKYDWLKGLNFVYQRMGEDFIYDDPNKHLTFVDNHDMSRIYTVVKEDMNAWKRIMTLMLTMRGMPCIYYGTEILMPGDRAESDAYVRFDFPGGWNSDEKNKFNKSDRTKLENEAFDYLRTLNKFRLTHDLFIDGKTTQYAGENETYCYFRHNNNSSAMVIFNQSKDERKVNLNRFNENLNGFKTLRNIHTGKTYDLNKKELVLSGEESAVFELIP